MALVTISAPYGTGGSRIGPEVARRLDARFLDRAIPTAVADRLAVPLEQALQRDEAVSGVLSRVLLGFGPAAEVVTTAAVPIEVLSDRQYLQATEQVLREHAEGGRAVILGRAAAVVLADVPQALHVRLDAHPERRIAHGMAAEGVDRATAERHLRDTDRARDAYVRHFYRCDAADPRLYHLVIDSTTLGPDACVELIVTAARDRARSDAPPAAP
jgi:cytidylate kinase